MIKQENAAKAEPRGGSGAAGTPAPRSSAEKSDRPGRLSRATRPPAHNQKRVAAALGGARSGLRRPACLAAAVTRFLWWGAPQPALRANGVPFTRATPREKVRPSVDLLVRSGSLNRIRERVAVEVERPRPWSLLIGHSTDTATRFLSWAASLSYRRTNDVPATSAARPTPEPRLQPSARVGPVPQLPGRHLPQARRHPRPAGGDPLPSRFSPGLPGDRTETRKEQAVRSLLREALGAEPCLDAEHSQLLRGAPRHQTQSHRHDRKPETGGSAACARQDRASKPKPPWAGTRLGHWSDSVQGAPQHEEFVKAGRFSPGDPPRRYPFAPRGKGRASKAISQARRQHVRPPPERSSRSRPVRAAQAPSRTSVIRMD
jgi:hypothetical protein